MKMWIAWSRNDCEANCLVYRWKCELLDLAKKMWIAWYKDELVNCLVYRRPCELPGPEIAWARNCLGNCLGQKLPCGELLGPELSYSWKAWSSRSRPEWELLASSVCSLYAGLLGTRRSQWLSVHQWLCACFYVSTLWSVVFLIGFCFVFLICSAGSSKEHSV